MVQIVQDGNCLPPGILGGIRFGGGFVGIPEARERVGFRVAVTELLVEFEGLPMVVDGLSIIAQVMVGVSKSLQRFVLEAIS